MREDFTSGGSRNNCKTVVMGMSIYLHKGNVIELQTTTIEKVVERYGNQSFQVWQLVVIKMFHVLCMYSNFEMDCNWHFSTAITG